MKNSDVIVVGGGLAGLTAAAAARAAGARVVLMAKGVGTIAIGSSSIDVLGYLPDGRLATSAETGLASLSADHPYAKIGAEGLVEGLDFFRGLVDRVGYSYRGDVHSRKWLITAAGTLKPSCLVPRSMDTACLADAAQVAVVGFEGMKDYYPEFVARGLSKHVGQGRDYRIVRLETGLTLGRDVTALDIARAMDGEAGRREFVRRLKPLLPRGTVAVVPPILGTRPDCGLLDQLEVETGCRFIETVGLPPAVTGLRLRNLLVRHLREQGVQIIEQANVTAAVTEGGRCLAVRTDNLDRSRTYYARAFVLATGGFYGGGISMGMDAAAEPIFGLPVQRSSDQAEWARESLLAREGQPFARSGLNVDRLLRPADGRGETLLSNVYVAGRNLAGYDYCQEKSGNGVAVASGYRAGKLAGEGRE